MPYPNFPDKHLGSPLVPPQRFLDYARARGQLADFEPPAGVLLLYQRSSMASLIQREEAEQLPVMGQYPLYELPRTGGVVVWSATSGSADRLSASSSRSSPR